MKKSLLFLVRVNKEREIKTKVIAVLSKSDTRIFNERRRWQDKGWMVIQVLNITKSGK